jgi:hypothetical protein
MIIVLSLMGVCVLLATQLCSRQLTPSNHTHIVYTHELHRRAYTLWWVYIFIIIVLVLFDFGGYYSSCAPVLSFWCYIYSCDYCWYVLRFLLFRH